VKISVRPGLRGGRAAPRFNELPGQHGPFRCINSFNPFLPCHLGPFHSARSNLPHASSPLLSFLTTAAADPL